MITLAEAGYRIEKYCKNYYDIFERYHEPHRYYHNINHLLKMLDYWFMNCEKGDFVLSSYGFSHLDLLYAILFHDIVYEPQRNNNEEKSIEVFNNWVDIPLEVNREEVIKAILVTKEPQHFEKFNGLSRFLVYLDTKDLEDFEEMIKNEKLLFKEFQFLDFSEYKSKRLEFLNKIPNVNKEYLKYLENKEVNIGVYEDNFIPFHLGHKNILEKAERIFDKVIILTNSQFLRWNENLEYLKYHQVDIYDGVITDYLENKKYNLTLIRGLNNSTNLQEELNYQRFLQDNKPNIKIINIACDKEFDYITSDFLDKIWNMGFDINKFTVK